MKILNNCKLTYFAIPGRGESIRLALAIGGVNFEDDRIQNWPAIKPTTPWGSVPMLTLSTGEVIAQQRTILRMVGKETGLYPEDVVQAALVDSLIDAVDDLLAMTSKVGNGLPQTEKETARAAAMAKGGTSYSYLERMEAFVGRHGSDGYAVGKSLTVGDLFLFATISGLLPKPYNRSRNSQSPSQPREFQNCRF